MEVDFRRAKSEPTCPVRVHSTRRWPKSHHHPSRYHTRRVDTVRSSTPLWSSRGRGALSSGVAAAVPESRSPQAVHARARLSRHERPDGNARAAIPPPQLVPPAVPPSTATPRPAGRRHPKQPRPAAAPQPRRRCRCCRSARQARPPRRSPVATPAVPPPLPRRAPTAAARNGWHERARASTHSWTPPWPTTGWRTPARTRRSGVERPTAAAVRGRPRRRDGRADALADSGAPAASARGDASGHGT